MHVYQCSHPGTRDARIHAFKQMREYLKQNGLSSQISNTFVNMCESVCSEKAMKPRYPPSAGLDNAILTEPMQPSKRLHPQRLPFNRVVSNTTTTQQKQRRKIDDSLASLSVEDTVYTNMGF